MKLLFDQNLSFKLCQQLADEQYDRIDAQTI